MQPHLPHQMKYVNLACKKAFVHEHAADSTCHWIDIFTLLGYIVFHDSQLRQRVASNLNASSLMLTARGYTKWLCMNDAALWATNLVKLLAVISALIPLPFLN